MLQAIPQDARFALSGIGGALAGGLVAAKTYKPQSAVGGFITLDSLKPIGGILAGSASGLLLYGGGKALADGSAAPLSHGLGLLLLAVAGGFTFGGVVAGDLRHEPSSSGRGQAFVVGATVGTILTPAVYSLGESLAGQQLTLAMLFGAAAVAGAVKHKK